MGSASQRARQTHRWALAVLVVSAGLPVLAGTTLAVALPSVAAGLQASPPAAVAVVAVYFAVQVAAQPFTGVLADVVGAHRVVRWGLGVLAAGSLAAALSPVLPALLAARGLQAVGVALVLPGVHAALAADQTRDCRRFAWLTSVGNITAAVGPLLGGLLVAQVGWRGVFGVTMLLAAGAALALSSRPCRPPLVPTAAQRLPLGEVLADRRAAAAAGLNALDNLVLQTLLIGVPFALVAADGLSAAHAVAVVALAGALAAPFGARLADRLGRAVAARAGFLVAAVGLLALHQAGLARGPGTALVAFAVVGAGLGLELPSVQAAPLALVAAAGRATAAGVAATARQLGSLGGALLVAAVVATDPAAVFAVGAAGAGAAALLAGTTDPANAASPAVA
jgi:MFS family permease